MIDWMAVDRECRRKSLASTVRQVLSCPRGGDSVPATWESGHLGFSSQVSVPDSGSQVGHFLSVACSLLICKTAVEPKDF